MYEPINQEGLLRLVIILLLVSTSAFSKEYKLEIFCQDLNTVIQKIHIHSINIANIKTTRTVSGGHYKRRVIKSCSKGHCVTIEDPSSPLLIYEPTHPDARENGYVAFPSFSLEEEQNKLQKAQSVYQMIFRAHSLDPKEILVGSKYDNCFNKYSFVREQFDYKSYLGR